MWELGALFVLWLIVAPVLGVIAFARKDNKFEINALRDEVRELHTQVRALTRQIEVRGEGAPSEEASPTAVEPEEAVLPPGFVVTDEKPPQEDTEPDISEDKAEEKGVDEGAGEELPVAAMGTPAEERPAGAVPLTSRAARSLSQSSEEEPPTPEPAPVPQPERASNRSEAMFASRWLVWLGGITIAIGGAFLVAYSVEAGLLGPAQRIGLAILLGVAGVIAGEYTRRNPLSRAAVAAGTNTIPAALTAAGIAITFAAIYGGYGLHGFFGSFPSFLLLSGTAAAAVALALLHERYGVFIAALGLLGAYVVPMLVATGEPNAAGLFLYVGLLNIAALSVLRWRDWIWLAWGVFAGAVFWPLIYISAVDLSVSDVMIIGSYATASAAIAALLLSTGRTLPDFSTADPATWPLLKDAQGLWISLASITVASALLVILALQSTYATEGIVQVLVGALVFAGLAATIRSLFPAAFISILMIGVLIILWPVAGRFGLEWGPEIFARVAPGNGPLFPPETQRLVGVTVFAMAAMFLIGLYKMGRERAGYWGTIAAIAPIGFFTLAYLRLAEYPHAFHWNLAALAIFALYGVVCWFIWTQRAREGAQNAFAAFTVGMTFSSSLFMAFSLEHAWLTVALAVQVPVLAAIHQRLYVPVLRYIAAVIAGVILVRLLANPDVANYALSGENPLWNWVWYGYGIPAIAMALGARWFEDKGRELNSVGILQAAAIALFTVMVTLEIRIFAAGDAWDINNYSLFESSLDVIAWAAIGVALYFRISQPTAVIRFLRGLLVRYAAVHAILFNVFLFNPLWWRVEVAPWPVLNVLGLAYLFPALLAGFATWISLGRLEKDRLMPAELSGVAAFLLGFAYVNLEIRSLFNEGGLRLWEGHTGAEIFAYPIAWLLAGLVMMLFRFQGQTAFLRNIRSALVVLGTVYVVFVNLMIQNPLLVPINVGFLPLFNLLAAAFLIPAALSMALYLLTPHARADDLPLPRNLLPPLSFVLCFVWVTAEVRHLFTGPVLFGPKVSEAELYAYSGAWFLMAAGLMAYGMSRANQRIRFAALALLALVVAKVFVVDMSQLEGIFRVLSFIGLGLGLVGIGFAYQRFVLPQEGASNEMNEE